MNNDLSRIPEEPYRVALPDMIHYPSWACESTYEELVRRQPEMTLPVAIACIVINYEDLFRKLKLTPTHNNELLSEAMRSHNPYYLERLFKESQENSEVEMLLGWSKEEFGKSHRMVAIETTTSIVPMNLDGLTVSDEQGGEYNGTYADFSSLDLFVCAPDEMRIPDASGNCKDLREMYGDACNPEAKIKREAEEKARREEPEAKIKHEEPGIALGEDLSQW